MIDYNYPSPDRFVILFFAPVMVLLSHIQYLWGAGTWSLRAVVAAVLMFVAMMLFNMMPGGPALLKDDIREPSFMIPPILTIVITAIYYASTKSISGLEWIHVYLLFIAVFVSWTVLCGVVRFQSLIWKWESIRDAARYIR